jgi:hypothetical protein
MLPFGALGAAVRVVQPSRVPGGASLEKASNHPTLINLPTCIDFRPIVDQLQYYFANLKEPN